MKEIIEKIKSWNLEDQFDIVERDEVIKKLTSDNSDYTKCPDCGGKITIVKQSICTNRDCISYALK